MINSIIILYTRLGYINGKHNNYYSQCENLYFIVASINIKQCIYAYKSNTKCIMYTKSYIL